MTKLWAVLLDIGTADPLVYGPTEDEDTARDFAAFLTTEVEPARVVELLSPTKQLISFWKHHNEERKP